MEPYIGIDLVIATANETAVEELSHDKEAGAYADATYAGQHWVMLQHLRQETAAQWSCNRAQRDGQHESFFSDARPASGARVEHPVPANKLQSAM